MCTYIHIHIISKCISYITFVVQHKVKRLQTAAAAGPVGAAAHRRRRREAAGAARGEGAAAPPPSPAPNDMSHSI